MQIVIDINENVYTRLFDCGTEDMNDLNSIKACNAIRKGTPISDNATNGDVIKAMFPNTSLHIDERSHTVWVGYEEMSFRIDWWNAPYQKGGKK